MPMWGSTGPECRAHWSAACRKRWSSSWGRLRSASFPSTAEARSSPPSPQLTGEDRPTPRGSKVTTSYPSVQVHELPALGGQLGDAGPARAAEVQQHRALPLPRGAVAGEGHVEGAARGRA